MCECVLWQTKVINQIGLLLLLLLDCNSLTYISLTLFRKNERTHPLWECTTRYATFVDSPIFCVFCRCFAINIESLWKFHVFYSFIIIITVMHVLMYNVFFFISSWRFAPAPSSSPLVAIARCSNVVINLIPSKFELYFDWRRQTNRSSISLGLAIIQRTNQINSIKTTSTKSTFFSFFSFWKHFWWFLYAFVSQLNLFLTVLRLHIVEQTKRRESKRILFRNVIIQRSFVY